MDYEDEEPSSTIKPSWNNLRGIIARNSNRNIDESASNIEISKLRAAIISGKNRPTRREYKPGSARQLAFHK